MSSDNRTAGFSHPLAKRHKADPSARRFGMKTFLEEILLKINVLTYFFLSADGMQRELYSLLGENTPPVVVFENRFKERPTWNKKAVPWSWASFSNPGRKDGLLLHHWIRGRHQHDNDEYMFAKFNQKLSIPQFAREDYDNILQDSDWTFEETRYLFDLCEEYDLRWIVIHDRYDFSANTYSIAKNTIAETKESQKVDTDKNDSTKKKLNPTESIKPVLISNVDPGYRTIEDLKARFYDVGRKILKYRHSRGETMGPGEDELYRQMKYSKESEVKRKEHLERLLSRSPAEIAEEEALVLESRKLEAAAEMMLLERAEILKILDAPTPTEKISEYQTSQGLSQLTNQLLAEKNKKRRDQQPLGSPTSDSPQHHTQSIHQLQPQQLQAQISSPNIQQIQQQQQVQQVQKQQEQQQQELQEQKQKPQSQNSQSQPQQDASQKINDEKLSNISKSVKTEVVNPNNSVSVATAKGTKKSGNKNKDSAKKGQLTGSNAIAAAIHHKLSSKEEAAYGLSYHDKLSAGVYLRSSKITSYKQTLQAKISQVLAELNISPRPVMPTAKVTAKFDSLQQSISVLLEAKKQADKLETEIRILRAQKPYQNTVGSEK